MEDALLPGVHERWLVPFIGNVEVCRRVVEVSYRVAEGQVQVGNQRVQVVALAHFSEPLCYHRNQPLSHWVHRQKGILQGDHSQEGGFGFLPRR